MEFLNDIFQYENNKVVQGLTEEISIQYIINSFNSNDDNVLVVLSSMYEANKFFQFIRTYTDKVYLFPMDEFLTSIAVAISPDLKLKRLETLEKIKTGQKCIIVTHLMGYLKYLTNVDVFNNSKLSYQLGDVINRDELIKYLENYGYNQTSIVTSTGEYAIRGFIIDIYIFNQDYPIRIELFGNEIESIRYFDASSQISKEEINSFDIISLNENIGDKHNSIYDYLNKPQVFFIDFDLIKSSYKKLQEDIFEYNLSKNIDVNFKYMFDFNEIYVEKQTFINIFSNNENINGINYFSREIENFNSDFDLLKQFVLANKDKTIIFCLSNNYQINKIKELFSEVNVGDIKEKQINIINNKINKGFIIDSFIVISEYDIENIKREIKYKNNFKLGKKIKNFNDLSIGDYVVHASHGIGIYGGVITLEKKGLKKDYLLINYQGNDKIYVPVEKIELIYKFSDKDGMRPKIDKLNSTSWAKTKLRVKSRIKDISGELIKLYASRMAIKGEKYIDFADEVLFSQDFPYEETNDQLKCINDINDDLKSEKPMERLLCGDVGFGKTEVAFRAIFKTIMNGKQVAYLCPTTLLSRQHYNNAINRFRHFAINIALLNRFTSAKEVTRIIKGLKDGTIDFVIGTHKLFNDKIDYKNLGLLVIDEEQRFGVAHKEKIKELKNSINVLTLSATPIPRTMKMAMSGLKDMSVIDTAPINRYPVQTYVLEENDVIMKDAIYRELSRGGQVFILYNKVANIEEFVTKISRLIPDADVEFAHGQMDKNELEEVISKFVNNEFNILVCTTIIETGIDIPNVNTLIVIDADNFGLSQLYQIRGRVGRSDKIAYAYLMYKPAKVLTETAIKRLKSIKDFTELGSGYKIAMRDLSIRGAGELLGSEQAGFVDSVGIELYMKMLEEEIKKLKGEYVEEDGEEKQNLIDVETHITDEMTDDESLKIEIHKLINTVSDENKFKQVKSELEDRFGKLSDNIIIYMYEEWFEHLCKRLKIIKVNQQYNSIEIEIPEDISNNVQGDKLFLEIYQISINFKLRYFNKKIYISLKTNNLKEHFLFYLVKLLELIINNVNNE